MTLQEAKALKTGDYIHHVIKKNADGSPMRARVTSIKTWKRSPERIEVRCKHGLYDYATFTEHELSQIAVGYGRK